MQSITTVKIVFFPFIYIPALVDIKNNLALLFSSSLKADICFCLMSQFVPPSMRK